VSTELLIVLLVIVAGFAGLYWLLRQHLADQRTGPEELENLVNRVFGQSAQKIAEQSRHILQGEKETIKVDLDNKHKTIEKLVKTLQDDIKVRQQEIRGIEQDRTRKFSELTSALEQHRKLTDELNVSTQELAKVLSNNQQRGEWGERIIEDLLTSHGLREGKHYRRQSTMGTGLRPDITLLLPNNRTVPIDVKFPYSAIQHMSRADTKAGKLQYRKQFSRDVRQKIDKVAEYISPADDTLDYAILFVPNEMIFSFINQQFPELVDRAIARRVLMVSPFTFLIVARTVMESYRNFMISDKLRDVIGYVDDFVGEWGKFKDQFEKYGRSIATLQSDYEALTGTRVRQMERKVKRIEDYGVAKLEEDKQLEETGQLGLEKGE